LLAASFWALAADVSKENFDPLESEPLDLLLGRTSDFELALGAVAGWPLDDLGLSGAERLDLALLLGAAAGFGLGLELGLEKDFPPDEPDE
jgi:hypothetical protein